MKNSEHTFTFYAVTVKSTDIPTKLIKELCDFFSQFTYKSIIHCITEENFLKYHINEIYRKASQNFHALSSIAKINPKIKGVLFKSSIISKFNYFPIVWICHGRSLNNKTNHIHERALRIVYQEKKIRLRNFIKM